MKLKGSAEFKADRKRDVITARTHCRVECGNLGVALWQTNAEKLSSGVLLVSIQVNHGQLVAPPPQLYLDQ